MRRFVLGDIHGEYEKLLSCLQQVNFDYKEDLLIQLGDVVDRGEKSFQCVEELMKIVNLVAIRGNHDECFIQGIYKGHFALFNQGARETIISYMKGGTEKEELKIRTDGSISNFKIEDMPNSHLAFFVNQVPYYILEDKLFVHGGFNRHYSIKDLNHNGEDVLYWDRDLLAQARSYESMRDKTKTFKNKDNFKEIYLGHTPVQYFVKSDKPQKWANVHLLDTGCGKGDFPLSIMNIDTHEIWQSKKGE